MIEAKLTIIVFLFLFISRWWTGRLGGVGFVWYWADIIKQIMILEGCSPCIAERLWLRALSIIHVNEMKWNTHKHHVQWRMRRDLCTICWFRNHVVATTSPFLLQCHLLNLLSLLMHLSLRLVQRILILKQILTSYILLLMPIVILAPLFSQSRNFQSFQRLRRPPDYAIGWFLLWYLCDIFVIFARGSHVTSWWS